MRALNDLRRFINAKNNDEDRAEIRAYLLENAGDLSEAFGVSVDAFREAIATVEDDVELSIRMLDGIRSASKDQRRAKYETVVKSAQQSAEILGAVAFWRGDRAEVDVTSLLSCALTRRDDVLVFVADKFAVGIRMAPLFDLRKLGRVDLTGWVDAKGLHVRWSSGGLNFFPTLDPHAARIIVPLAGRARFAA